MAFRISVLQGSVNPRANPLTCFRRAVGHGIAVLAALYLPTGIAQSSEVATQMTAIRAGRLIDVEAGRVLNEQLILVQGGRIEAVGPASSVRIPDGAKVIDL